ncbi:MAG: DoxX family protein [Candidatus Dormibacteria bacterium]
MGEEHHDPGLVGRLGRVGLAAIFIQSGIDVAREPGQRVAKVEAMGVPQAELMTRLNGVGMAVAGTALALGIRPRESALALLGLLIPTTLVGHAFWREEGPARRMQQVHVLKNIGIAGGLLTVIAGES